MENASLVKDDETERITVSIPVRMPEEELVSSASVRASFYGEVIAELNCNIARLKETGESVGIISEQDAYEFARRYGNLQLGSGGRWDCENAVLDSVTLEYGESIYGLNSFQADALIPYYVFSGTYQTESGRIDSLEHLGGCAPPLSKKQTQGSRLVAILLFVKHKFNE